MTHEGIKWEDFKYLLEILGIDLTTPGWQLHDGEIFFSDQGAKALLSLAEERAGSMFRESLEPDHNLNYESLQHALASFYIDRLEDVRHGLDYKVELLSLKRLVTEETYPNLYHFIVAIPGVKGFGIDRDTHNGYHFHYVRIKSKSEERTNVIFMFNPKEPQILNPVLYWEPHHQNSHVHIDPCLFGQRRRMAIYDTCTPSLSKVPKDKFRMPSKNASKFHP